MKKILVFILFAFGFSIASACTCVPIFDENGKERSLAEQYEDYEAIFVGKVLRIDSIYVIPEVFIRKKMVDPDSTLGFFAQQVKVTMLIEKKLKGKLRGQQIAVFTGIGGGDCGFTFKIGVSHFVYARKEEIRLVNEKDGKKYLTKESVLSTTDCDRTTTAVKQETNLLQQALRRKKQVD